MIHTLEYGLSLSLSLSFSYESAVLHTHPIDKIR
jgi:hypothetical protein